MKKFGGAVRADLLAYVAVWMLAANGPAAARDATEMTLAKGARVGVVNLLDPEVTQFHSAKSLKDSFLKTRTVNWPVAVMLGQALKDRLAEMGLVLVPVGGTNLLERSREDCFLNSAPGKGLPKECGPPFAELAAAEHLDAIIALGPGLNNSAHAAGGRRKDLPDYLRGWGFVTGADASPSGKPTLFNMTELLLFSVSPSGAVLRGREWGGNYTLEWADFMPPPDIKDLPQQQVDQLQPLFGSLLSRQSSRLLDQLEVLR